MRVTYIKFGIHIQIRLMWQSSKPSDDVYIDSVRKIILRRKKNGAEEWNRYFTSKEECGYAVLEL